MAKTRLEELEKLNENFITSQQELEKLKLEVSKCSFIDSILKLYFTVHIPIQCIIKSFFFLDKPNA